MKVVGLVSGGKDSCFNMMECVQHGHEVRITRLFSTPSFCHPHQL